VPSTAQRTQPRKRIDELQIARRVMHLADPVCAAEGLELVFVEFQRECGGRVMRLYIDKPGGGVSLDDCVAVSRQVSDLLDIYLDADIVYNLEVSSPGNNRPLGKLSDFERFKGHRIDLRFEPVSHRNGEASSRRRRTKAVLKGVCGNNIHVEINGHEMVIAHEHVIKACLVDYHGDK